jgi:hypothetical protein
VKFRPLHILLVVGIILRVALWLANPPGNSYDDHLEPIRKYADNSSRPEVFECWQCYQPPAYYTIAAGVLKLGEFLELNNHTSWKLVQLVNTLLSILILLLFYRIIRESNIQDHIGFLIFSFLAFLPREFFMSAIIGNDYLLLFSACFATYFYFKVQRKNQTRKSTLTNFLLMGFFVILGALTKQHGLLLILFPISCLHLFYKNGKVKLGLAIPLAFAMLLLAGMDEFWKFYQTGAFLISNQHHYNYAEGQFPGSVNLVEFHTFRIIGLFQSPFLSNDTSASFFTELFARTFFDYEWRFFSPNQPLSISLGRAAYIIGISWIVFLGWQSIKAFKKLKSMTKVFSKKGLVTWAPLIIALGYMLVPVLQTFRFPYYSSMKAMFIMPGVMIILIIIIKNGRKIQFPKSASYVLGSLTVGYSISMVILIIMNLNSSLEYLSGPIWNLH